VTKSYDQVVGLNYNETILNSKIQQMDVKTGFINKDLNEVIYMKQSEGFIHKLQKWHIYLLVKSIYRLKQAPKMWNEHISSFLTSLGFVRNIKNSRLYILRKEIIFLFFALHR
jgi:hypothetical protein